MISSRSGRDAPPQKLKVDGRISQKLCRERLPWVALMIWGISNSFSFCPAKFEWDETSIFLLLRKWDRGVSKYLPSASWEWSRWEWQIPSEMGTRRTAQTSIKQEWNEKPAFLGRIVTAVIGRWTITSLAPAMILSVNGKILLLWTMSYPRKYFAWDKAIIMAEEEIKPEITEWLMNRSSQPSLQQQHNKRWE